VPSRVSRTAALLPSLGLNGRDALGLAVGICAVAAVLVNALLMQSGPHPAPMFKPKPAAARPVAVTEAMPPAVAVPKPKPIDAMPLTAATSPKVVAAAAPAKPAGPAAARTPGEIITDIQRELARRGFFDGTVDGFYGPKTDTAIRDFEHAAGLKASPEPNEVLLQAMLHAPAKITRGVAAPAVAASAAVARPPAPVRNDVERPQPSKRVLAVQRVLADYGYGQIKPTGLVDGETQAAIEKFERERKLPVTGQPSDRVARELAAVTGRPLE
jgi:peptidoglycan hydrolase-like protein with peptidoglycan-binding domain